MAKLTRGLMLSRSQKQKLRKKRRDEEFARKREHKDFIDMTGGRDALAARRAKKKGKIPVDVTTSALKGITSGTGGSRSFRAKVKETNGRRFAFLKEPPT